MGIRFTLQTQLVVQALLRDPARELYGRELSALTGLMPGTTHPILLRLEAGGWITSRKEDIDPHKAKRPARRYYRFTGNGAAQASDALAAARRPHSTALRGLAEEGGAS